MIVIIYTHLSVDASQLLFDCLPHVLLPRWTHLHRKSTNVLPAKWCMGDERERGGEGERRDEKEREREKGREETGGRT